MLRSLFRRDILQGSKRVLYTNGKGVFRDQPVSDINDDDVGFDRKVLADVRFGFEVAEAPSCLG